MGIFVDVDKMIIKCIWKCQELKNCHDNLKEQSWRIYTNIKMYQTTRTLLYWHTDGQKKTNEQEN